MPPLRWLDIDILEMSRCLACNAYQLWISWKGRGYLKGVMEAKEAFYRSISQNNYLKY